MADVLAHLHMLVNGQPTNAAVLLFGRDPQRFMSSAEVRCMHFHGTEVQRPAPYYQIFKGRLFEQVDRASDFVLSVLNRSVGTRIESAQAPVAYEIPPDVVREAIVNAVAHRDYALAGAVQVSVFADRVEVWNPGVLPPPLTLERLRQPHGSVARNAGVCEAMFLARYIEKYGTGTLMMIQESVEHALPEPDFEQRAGEFAVTVWRDWLTVNVLAQLGLNERQKKALMQIRAQRRLTSANYQELTRASRPTATRDLDDLVNKGLLDRRGEGRGTHYVLARRLPQK
jgi:predicted HTH transcriptional regulator